MVCTNWDDFLSNILLKRQIGCASSWGIKILYGKSNEISYYMNCYFTYFFRRLKSWWRLKFHLQYIVQWHSKGYKGLKNIFLNIIEAIFLLKGVKFEMLLNFKSKEIPRVEIPSFLPSLTVSGFYALFLLHQCNFLSLIFLDFFSFPFPCFIEIR